MIDVLGWYEILYAVGVNVGPGLPVLLSFVNFKIGWWLIDENNVIQVITAVSVLIIFVVTWFHVIDLSKELDLIKADFTAAQEGRSFLKNKEKEKFHLSNDPFEDSINKELNGNDTRSVEELGEDKELDRSRYSKKKNLMKWKDLLQFDILSLALSFALLRATVLYSVTNLTLITTKTFGWSLNTLSWLHVISGSSSYLLITGLVKWNVFKGRITIFYSYIGGLCAALIIYSMLLLPKAVPMTHISSQVIFGGIILFLKCHVMFQANSSGKFLIFNTVSFDNANFVDGFRSSVGNFFKLVANLTVFFFYLHPEFFSPSMFTIGIVLIVLLLSRREKHCGISI